MRGCPNLFLTLTSVGRTGQSVYAELDTLRGQLSASPELLGAKLLSVFTAQASKQGVREMRALI
jgi:hypothetical protein